MFFVSFLRIS